MKFGEQEVQLLILDVDGVLIDNQPLLQQHVSNTARELGLSAEKVPWYFQEARMGRIRRDSTIGHMLVTLWPELCATGTRDFRTRLRKKEKSIPYPPYEDTAKTLVWLSMQGVFLALCTSNNQEALEDKFRGADLNLSIFHAVSVKNGMLGKPHRSVLKPIFEQIQVRPEKVLYIADWHPDIDLARNWGVPFVGVCSGIYCREAFLQEGIPETHILEKLSDLRKYVS